MSRFTSIRTEDGTAIVRDPQTGLVVSGATLADAMAELRRLLAHPSASAQPAREGVSV